MFSSFIQLIKQSDIFKVLKQYNFGTLSDGKLELIIVIVVLVILGIIIGKATNKIGKTNSSIFTIIFFLLAAIILLTYTGAIRINI